MKCLSYAFSNWTLFNINNMNKIILEVRYNSSYRKEWSVSSLVPNFHSPWPLFFGNSVQWNNLKIIMSKQKPPRICKWLSKRKSHISQLKPFYLFISQSIKDFGGTLPASLYPQHSRKTRRKPDLASFYLILNHRPRYKTVTKTQTSILSGSKITFD